MIRQAIVFPFREGLLWRLRGLTVVPRIQSLENIGDVLNHIHGAGANTRCLLVESKNPLTSAGLHQGLAGVPIALKVPALGSFADFFRLLPVVRQMNLRVYLPAEGDGNLTSLRVLSSLGIETAVTFDGKEPDWDGLTDLMTYAFFGQAPHASIAPFGFLGEVFDQRGRSEFQAIYFEDPKSYLYMDEEGRVALTSADLRSGQFISGSIAELGKGAEELGPCVEGLEGWRNHFLDFDRCSTCPGWRVCSGWLARDRKPNDRCRSFFSELLDNLEQHRSMRRNPLTVWRP